MVGPLVPLDPGNGLRVVDVVELDELLLDEEDGEVELDDDDEDEDDDEGVDGSLRGVVVDWAVAVAAVMPATTAITTETMTTRVRRPNLATRGERGLRDPVRLELHGSKRRPPPGGNAV